VVDETPPLSQTLVRDCAVSGALLAQLGQCEVELRRTCGLGFDGCDGLSSAATSTTARVRKAAYISLNWA